MKPHDVKPSFVLSRTLENYPEIIRNRRGNASKFLNVKCPDCRAIANIFWNQNYKKKTLPMRLQVEYILVR